MASGPVDLLAEVVFAARREQARGVGDALLRRTRLGLLAAREVADPSGTAARRVAQRHGAPTWAGTSAAWRPRCGAFLDEAAAEGIVAGAS